MHPIYDEDLARIAQRLAGQAQMFSGKRILIVGAMGFLGQLFRGVFAKLNDGILASPCSVLTVDSFITASDSPSAEHPAAGETFFRHDIREPLSFDETVDFVVHAAGVASPFYYRKFPVETIEVATLGTRNILELTRAHGARMLYFSSSEIYGDPDADNIPTREEYRGNVACLGPRACYDESKRMGETLCYIHANYFDTEVSIVRPFNVYGPGMRENDYRVLPNFANAIKAGQPLTIYASGRQTRTYCYTVDAMSGFLLALLQGRASEPYNIGTSGPEISVRELAGIVEAASGSRLERTYRDYPDSYPADEPQRRCPELGKARRELGYKPEVRIEEGVKRYLAWAAENYTGKR
ncbi:MAG: NAD-dependent epimerase/dehydratase family protein [Gammaproteobacteria bacterium]|nr:NAD-dependent epimerase/dehydratase family protein [Gammaproteobacteria bacterium]